MNSDAIDVEERAAAEWWCESCQEAVDDPDTRYECGNCGEEFGLADEGSHKCPSCGHFAAKTTNHGCPNCGEELVEGGQTASVPESPKTGPDKA